MVSAQSALPAFPPGTSPFHAKGTLWLGIRQFAVERVPGGVAAVVARLDAPHGAFFSEMYLASGWYDILPAVRISLAIAAAMNVDLTEYQREAAVWQAERDMRGAYAPVLKFDTPEAVCRRFTSIHALMYDFGRAEVVREEPRRVHACAHGMPEPLAGWWMRASEAYLDPVLRAAGARNPRLIWSPMEPDSVQAGMPLVRIPSVTTWS